MSNSLSLASAIEANRLSSDVPWLCLIDLEVVDPLTGVVVTVLHFANNTEEVTFQGIEYVASQFDMTVKQEAGKTADVSLTVTDMTQAIEFYMESYGGGVGSNVTLYVVNAGNLAQGPEVVEYFQITDASSADYRHSFRLGAENVLMQTFPRRRQTKNFCQWRYKDPDTCRYAGPLTSCDLTLQGDNGCAAHANTLNFGAYPGMNSNGYRYG